MNTLQHELGKQHPFESPAQEAHLNAARTASALDARFDRLFRAHGLTGSSYNALRIVRGGGPVPCQEIGDRLIVRVPDVTRLIDRLEARGLVRRERSTEDRRVVHVSITKSGRAVLDELDPAVLAVHEQQLVHMSSEDLRELSRLLVLARRGCGAPQGAPS